MISASLNLKSKWPIIFIAALCAVSALSFLFFPDQVLVSRTDQVLQSSSSEHWLGTDSLGRDYLARLAMGTRISLLVSFFSSAISMIIGILLGSWLSHSARWNRFLFSRAVDLLQGLPSFMLIAIIMQALNSSSWILLSFLMGIFHWPSLARLTQSQVFKIQAEPYIEASRALGAKPFYILRTHIWPACYPVWMAWLCFHLPAEIMFESSLSFLGFGVQPPQVSLGVLIQEAWQYLAVRPHFLFAPSAVIFALVFVLYRGRSAER